MSGMTLVGSVLLGILCGLAMFAFSANFLFIKFHKILKNPFYMDSLSTNIAIVIGGLTFMVVVLILFISFGLTGKII